MNPRRDILRENINLTHFAGPLVDLGLPHLNGN
jgi:hypothetical protein